MLAEAESSRQTRPHHIDWIFIQFGSGVATKGWSNHGSCSQVSSKVPPSGVA